MPGSKKKSDVNYREGMTLLEMDSDSDENIEHFALGGMNATTATRRRKNDCCCTKEKVAMLFILSFMIAALAVLALQHMSLQRQVTELMLRNNTEPIKSSQENQGNQEELNELRSKVAELTKQVEKLDSETMSNVKKSMTEHSAKLAQLDERLGSVESDVSHKSIPKEFTDLQQNYLSLGSDLQTVKDDIRNLQTFQSDTNTKFETQDAQIEQLLSNNDDQGDSENQSNPDFAARLQSVVQSVDRVNTSLSVKIKALTQASEASQVQLANLMDTTTSLESEVTLLKVSAADPSNPTPSPGNAAPDTAAVQTLIQDALKNYSLGGSSSGSEVDLSDYNATVQAQILKIQNRLSIVEEQAFEDLVSANVFQAFKNTTDSQYKSVSGQLVEVTSGLEALKMRVQVHEDSIQGLRAELNSDPSNALEGNPEETGEGSDGGDSNVANGGGDGLLGGDDGHLPPWLNLDTTPTSKQEPKDEGEVAGTTTESDEEWTTGGVMANEHVTTAQDVRLEFYKWDRDGDEYVTYDDILGFYGPNMPSRQALAQFDWDEDHKYSVSEMQAAFGFQPDIYGPPESTSRTPLEGDDGVNTGAEEGDEEDRFKRHVQQTRKHLADTNDNQR